MSIVVHSLCNSNITLASDCSCMNKVCLPENNWSWLALGASLAQHQLKYVVKPGCFQPSALMEHPSQWLLILGAQL